MVLSYPAWMLLASALVMAQIPDLNSLMWKNRVMLLFAPSQDNRLLTEQKAKFEAESEDFAARDLKVFEITGDSVDAKKLRVRFDVKPGQFAVVLVGKDGGRKLKQDTIVEAAALFRKIDSMPMRRDEMRRQQGEQ